LVWLVEWVVVGRSRGRLQGWAGRGGEDEGRDGCSSTERYRELQPGPLHKKGCAGHIARLDGGGVVSGDPGL
jgi:hypothetical protein